MDIELAIINDYHRIGHDTKPIAPRKDAVLVVFTYKGRVPSGDVARLAYENQPDCIRKLKPFGCESGMFKDKGGYRLCIDGNYGPGAVVNMDELSQLIEWFDTYFSDLGPDGYGGCWHWRTAQGAYSLFAYNAIDYTQSEIDEIKEHERLWATFEPHLNDPDPGVPKS